MSLSLQGNRIQYFYTDLERARNFYVNTIGLQPVAETEYSHTLQIAASSFLTLVDIGHSHFRGDEPKTVTTAFVTDELEAWYVYLTAKGVPMERDFNPKAGSAHDGFVALDPEGYFLEFERFNRHPENTELLPTLAGLPTHYPAASDVPSSLGIKATVTWLYYEELAAGCRFLEEVFGLAKVVDQGFATIYRTSESGFLGPVQAGDGLHPFTAEKLVTPALFTGCLDEWHTSLQAGDVPLLHDEPELAGSDLSLMAVEDPAGYRIELHQIRLLATTVRLHETLQKAEPHYVNA